MKKFFILYSFTLIIISSGIYSQNNTNDTAVSSDESSDQTNPVVFTIDNDYSEWENIPDIARFSSFYNPYYFNKEYNKNSEVQKIENSLYWGYNGTNLRQIKIVFHSPALYFYNSFESPIAEGLIIFLYLYKDRQEEEKNKYTLEFNMHPVTGNGKILLWEKGKNFSSLVGFIAVNPRNLEGSLDINALPGDLQPDFMKEYSFDLTTCYFEKRSGMYEEFFFTTIYCKDIPNLESISE